MEETYLWFTRDPCGVICMLLTHAILLFSNYTVTSCLIHWASLGLWRFLVIVTFQTLALLAAISHLKCAFGDPGAVPRSPLQSSSSSEFAGGSARELQHPGQPSEGRSPQAAADAAAADAAAADPQQQGGRGPFADKCCARRGLLRLYAAVFCPLRVFKNFIGSKRVGSSNTRAEDGLEEGWSPPICRQCAAPKPLRAHHCSGCRRCIIRMDHHCPWINNCVGFLNQKFFMLFLLYVNLMCCTAFVVLVSRVVTCVDSSSSDSFDSADDPPGGGTGASWAPPSSEEALGGPLGEYAAVPSSLAEYQPGPEAELSTAAARKHWAAVQGTQSVALDPSADSVLHQQFDHSAPRRLLTADALADGLAYAAQDPITRFFVHRGGPQGPQSFEPSAASSSLFSDPMVNGSSHFDSAYDRPRHRHRKRHFLCDVTLESAVCGAMTFMFSFIFGLFTIVMFLDQLSSILSNTTGIETLKKVKNEQKSAYQSLKEVFGGPFGCYWFLPWPVTAFQFKRFAAELQRFPGVPEREAASEGNGVFVASVRSAYEADPAGLPLANRRGRSPYNTEDGLSEGSSASLAFQPQPVEPLNAAQHQGLADADRDQKVSVSSSLQWVAADEASREQQETADRQAAAASVFTSPILRQPRPLHCPPAAAAAGTADALLGQRWRINSAEAPLASDPPPTESVGPF